MESAMRVPDQTGALDGAWHSPGYLASGLRPSVGGGPPISL